MFWGRGVNSGSVAYTCGKERGIFSDGGGDSGRIACSCISWEGGVAYRCLKGWSILRG